MSGPRSAAPRSLTFRLSAMFALGSFVLLAGIGAFLYLTLKQQLTERDNIELLGKVDLYRHMLAQVDSYASIAADPERWQEVVVGHPGLSMAVADAERRVLVSNTQGSVTIEPAESAHAFPVDEAAAFTRTLQPQDGRRLRRVSAWGRLARSTERPALIVLTLDVSEAEKLLARYLGNVVLAILLGGAAAVLGYFGVRRGLAPLRTIATAASDISASRLDQRLRLEETPRELQQLAESFNGMLDRLQDSFNRLGEFSSDLAHDLRTPINNLLGETQVALSRARSVQEYEAVLASNVEEYERLARMIENMLFLARTDDARTAVKRESLDGRAELERIAEYFRLVAEEQGVTIVCEGEARLFADAALVRRAVSNLVDNALKHTPKDGTVRLGLSQASDGSVDLSVTNPGHGIPLEAQPRIFDRFYRADSARAESQRGSGLGLAIVKSIALLHGGEVRVASRPQEGTSFTLRFPAPPFPTAQARGAVHNAG